MLVAAVAVLCVTDESVYGTPGTSSAGSQVGFALTYALSVTAQLSAFVMAFTACETTLVSARRSACQSTSFCVYCLSVDVHCLPVFNLPLFVFTACLSVSLPINPIMHLRNQSTSLWHLLSLD